MDWKIFCCRDVFDMGSRIPMTLQQCDKPIKHTHKTRTSQQYVCCAMESEAPFH